MRRPIFPLDSGLRTGLISRRPLEDKRLSRSFPSIDWTGWRAQERLRPAPTGIPALYGVRVSCGLEDFSKDDPRRKRESLTNQGTIPVEDHQRRQHMKSQGCS